MSEIPNSPRLTGIVSRLLVEKGFGFISAKGEDYFFHRSSAADFASLTEGDAVTFVRGSMARGPRAEAVQIVVAESSPF